MMKQKTKTTASPMTEENRSENVNESNQEKKETNVVKNKRAENHIKIKLLKTKKN